MSLYSITLPEAFPWLTEVRDHDEAGFLATTLLSGVWGISSFAVTADVRNGNIRFWMSDVSKGRFDILRERGLISAPDAVRTKP